MNFILAALLLLQSQPATGSISGTIISASAQRPLESARVELSNGLLPTLVVRSDGQGKFTFANLPSGSYRLRVTKDGYLRQEYAKRAAITIKPDVPHKSLIIPLELAPSIGGQVQNENNEPIGNILVRALRADYGPHGQRIFTVLASTLTDDRGEYRLYWLDPGDYILSASFVPEIETPNSPDTTVPRAVYAPTYYPFASDLANAQRISLRVGDNVHAQIFQLSHARAMTVRGTISTADNHRAPFTLVTLALAGDTTNVTQYSAKSNELGDFEILNVAPGSYAVSAETVIDKQRFAAAARVVVRDKDENDVGLKLSPGVPALGFIALDTRSPVNLSGVYVSLLSVDPYIESTNSSAIQGDGQFSIEKVQPGTYTIKVDGVPPNLYIKSERSAQTDLLESQLSVSLDSPATLEIVLGTDGGRVVGTVADPTTGQLFAGAQVVLVPNTERRDRPDQYRAVTSNEDGEFEIRGIPPGEYQLFAWENIEERAWLNPEFIANFRSTQFAVPANANGTVQLLLIHNRP